MSQLGQTRTSTRAIAKKQKRSEPPITGQNSGVNCSLQAVATSDVIGTPSEYTKPVGSYASLTWPFNCWPRDPIKRVPKLCREGVDTEGPPFSDHVICSRWFPSSIFHAMSMLPPGTDNAPNFVAFVQSSLSVIASAITAPDVILMSGPEILNRPWPLLSYGSVAPRIVLARSALAHWAYKSRSCARPSATRRP